MKLTDGEKLIALMLADLLQEREIHGEFDPALVKSTIVSGNLWALNWAYSGVFNEDEVDEGLAIEVRSILAMCSYLEQSITARIADGSLVRPNSTVFVGFDGNEEGEHYSAASTIVTELGLFNEFAARSMNSHAPMVEKYLRMLAVFKEIPLVNAAFTVPEIESILAA